MGACIVLVPVISAAWPVVSTAVLGAAAALGFAATAKKKETARQADRQTQVSIEVPGSRNVTDALAHDERLSFVKDGVTVTFARDERGRCGVSVAGEGRTKQELETVGREFAQQVVQRYAYHRLMEELSRKNFSVVSQEVGSDKTIHVSVRRFE